MFPGMNNKQMKQMMKQMGVKQQQIKDAQEVVIKCSDREIVISSPEVSKIKMMGQESWQVQGSAQERSLESSPDISEDDVETVVEQTGASEEKAKKAIEAADGDLAQAIMKLE